MSLNARRHIFPSQTILSNRGCTPKLGGVDHLPTWQDDQHGSVLVTVFGETPPLKFGDIIREKMHPHREEQTRSTRGESLAD